MFPATPPKCVRRLSMLNETFRMWSFSGRMWSLKRSGKTMMWSRAREPDTRMVMDSSREAQSRRPGAGRQPRRGALVDSPHADPGALRDGQARLLVRVLPAEDAAGLRPALPDDPGPEAPRSGLRVGDLGRRGLDASQDRGTRGRDPAGDRAHGD